MKKSIVLTGLLAAATGLFALGAAAQDQPAPQQDQASAEWMSVADLAAKLQSQGYTVEEIERDDGVYEVAMTDANGMRVEAYLDPVTGEPVGNRLRERDDDSGEHGDD